MRNTCPLCAANEHELLFEVKGLPLFQNKIYADVTAARSAATGDIVLRQCRSCNFVYNAAFMPERMVYDETYQNEQGHSPAFGRHLDAVAQLLIDAVGEDAAVLEIGCGKGTFLNVMRAKGVHKIGGFDPAYEGNDPAIVSDYFGNSAIDEPADLIVLRHTLEHIASPLDFLRTISDANEGRGKIFIEVPDFDWIENARAFWDIYYEHCNYFTRHTLDALFQQSRWWSLFQGQYQGLLADLSHLREHVPHVQRPKRHQVFPDLRAKYSQQQLGEGPVFVWGASSKGVTFLNQVDPTCQKIRALIDINPKKQDRYIPNTGHPIRPPEYLDSISETAVTILVANPNYLGEVKERTQDLDATYVCL